MLRSLNSGVTGLMNHQVRMDVIGNNISNVNTVGYKGRRLTMEEGFSQLMKGASRTESKAGGTNPMQVGLGSSVGSIDVMTGQGGLSNTGRVFDLAIEGNALFGVSDGTGVYYTRNGAFQLDSNGYIMLPTNGMVLQGKMADAHGNFPPGTAISNLQIPLNQQAPAKATTEVGIARNLNADGDAKGSIVHTGRFLHPADGARAPLVNSPNDTGRTETSLPSLYNSNGDHLAIKENDILTIRWAEDVGNATVHEYKLRVSQDVAGMSTTNGPPSDYENYLSGLSAGESPLVWNLDQLAMVLAEFTDTDVTLQLNGALQIDNTTSSNPHIFNLAITTSNPEDPSVITDAFFFNSHIGNIIGNYPDTRVVTSGVLLRPAEQFDYMHMLRNEKGVALSDGLESGDTIDITGMVGNNSIEDGKSHPLVYWDGITTPPPLNIGTGLPVSGATTLDDLINKIRNDFRLPPHYVDKDGVHIPSVGMNGVGTDDEIPDGSITIYGQKGEGFSINEVTIKAQNSNANTKAPTVFNSAATSTVKREAIDAEKPDIVITVYDSSGAEHDLRITFIHTGIAGEWEWRASFAGQQIITPLSGSGKLTFGQDGCVSSFLFDNGGSEIIVDPRNGADVMRIRLDVGGPGNSKGMVQMDAPSTVNSTGQNGYGTGHLVEVSIDDFGLIEGAFSNGTARAIGQIMVVDFANPGGLLGLTDSVYMPSANSGDPIWGLPKTQSSSQIRPGALEMSNIDLAGEFTTMITTQRGYQSNSRIITVSDSMLEELVNLKR